MEVILNKDIENLGFEYEIVSVKPGYGMNYLFPNKLAKLATPANREELNKILEDRREHEEAAIAKANEIISSMEGMTIELKAKVGEGEKLFGSINNADLTKYLNDKGVKVERKHVQILGKTVKRLGHYHGLVKPHREVEHEFTFDVIPE